jgi:putative tributyrin esterase
MPAIDREFPFAARDRAHTAIIGNSRGGYAAAIYALKHLELFSFVGGLSSAFDLADRSFRWHAPLDSFRYQKIFGPPGSPIRVANNPYLFAHSIARERSPYFYLLCGDRDSLLPANRRFVAELEASRLPHQFTIVPGGHNWGVWNAQLPALESALLAHFGLPPAATPGPSAP